MGVILAAKCECGYSVDRLFLEVGMATPLGSWLVPAYCESCSEIVAVDYAAKPLKCPVCSSLAVPYDDCSLQLPGNDVDRDRALLLWGGKHLGEATHVMPHSGYKCPKCHQFHLRFVAVGMWD
jgi:hypothetical protein